MDSLPEFDDVVAAQQRLAGLAVRTPVLESQSVNEFLKGRLFIKPEGLQRTGSFKFRGAYNLISGISAQEFPGGVVACSSGNHAQGVAEAARLCALPALVVMPEDAPELKIKRTKAFGAEVILYDRVLENREEIAAALTAERRAAFVPPYDHARIIAGQGTVGLELAEQVGELECSLDTVLIPCGGGGLSSGIGLSLQRIAPGAQIFVVEPEGFDDHKRSLRSGKRESNDQLSGSICDALLSPMPGELTFALNRKQLAGALAVDDASVLRAMKFAFEEFKLVVEPGGAVALAAVLEGLVEVEGKNIAVVLSGANIGAGQFAEILYKSS